MRLLTWLGVLLLAAACAGADTIVLKNGRRIPAEGVTEDGDHVVYQTPSGQMSLPKSIVERVERDNFAYASASRASSEPPVSAPQIEAVLGFEDVARLTVHDNAIDFAFIAQLESEARSGAPIPAQKVAAAHHVAAQFLIARGDTD